MQLSLNQSFLLTLNLHPNHTLKLQCYQQYNYVCLGSTSIVQNYKCFKDDIIIFENTIF